MQWLQFLYQFGVGGLIFLIGLVVCLRLERKAGNNDPLMRYYRNWLLAGYAYYFVLFLLWQMFALATDKGIG